jgi:hypothetical protein
MKLQMKREALEKLNRHANEMPAEKAGAHSGMVTLRSPCHEHEIGTVDEKNHGSRW